MEKGALVLEMVVPGKPEPQGSLTAYVIYSDRKGPDKTKWVPARRSDGSIMVNTTSDNDALEAWREGVGHTVRAELAGKGVRVSEGDDLVPFPVESAAFIVELDAHLYRAQNEWGTGRNAHLLKDHAPAFPCKYPDVDKLLRAAMDSLTGVLWADDSQVVAATTRKLFAVPDEDGDGQRAEIRVWLAQEQRAIDLPLELRRRVLNADPAREAPAPEGQEALA